jgi:hypothetical protein
VTRDFAFGIVTGRRFRPLLATVLFDLGSTDDDSSEISSTDCCDPSTSESSKSEMPTITTQLSGVRL